MISEFYPDAMEPYNNSGRILQGMGRYEDAVRMYERARNVDPRSSVPVHNQWWVLIQNLRRPVAAEEAVRTMIELEPESTWARHSVGWTLVALRRFDEAESQMRVVLEMDPTHRYARANLAHLLYRRGDFEGAIEHYRSLHEQSHASERIQSDEYDSLCLALALQGANLQDEARTVLETELANLRAELASPSTDPDDRGRESCLLAALGKTREASLRAREIEVAAADNPHQLFVVAETNALVGELDRAVTALVRAFEIGYDDPYYILLNPPLNALQGRPEIRELAPY
jgi:tetratricopeptide (TPR) repeat protein